MRFDFEDVFSVFETFVLVRCGSEYTATAAERLTVVLWAAANYVYVGFFVLAYRYREAFYASLAAGLLFGRLFLTAFAEVAESVKGGGPCTGGDNSAANEPCGLCAMMFFICVYWLAFEFVAHKPSCCKRQRGSANTTDDIELDPATALRHTLERSVTELVHPSRKTETAALLVIAFGHSIATAALGLASKRTVAFSACVGAVWCGVWCVFVYVAITPVFHEPWFQKLLGWFRMETRWFRGMITATATKT